MTQPSGDIGGEKSKLLELGSNRGRRTPRSLDSSDGVSALIPALRGVPPASANAYAYGADDNALTPGGYDVSIVRWRQWPARHAFFCGGRVMAGVHWKQCLLSLALLETTFAAYFCGPALFLTTLWINAGVILLVLATVSLIMTALTDPGVVPRVPGNPLVDLMPAGVKTSIRYCSTCHVLRPPRTKHCRYCDACVVGFDHHCPWTGNCIGERNYRVFLAFVTSAAASASLVSAACAWCLYFAFKNGYTSAGAGNDNSGSPGSSPGSSHTSAEAYSDSATAAAATVIPVWLCLGLGLWSAAAAAYLCSLASFHAWLVCVGATTNEYLRAQRTGQKPACSPCTVPQKCAQVWVHKTPPSRVPRMASLPSFEVDGAWAAAANAEALAALRRTLDVRTASSLERGVTPPRVAASIASPSAGGGGGGGGGGAGGYSSMVPGPRSPGPQYQPLNLCLPPGVASSSSSSSISGGGPGVPGDGRSSGAIVGGRRNPSGWSMAPLGPSCIDPSAARNREAEVVASEQNNPLAYATGRGSSLERDSRGSSMRSDGRSSSTDCRSQSRSLSRSRNAGQVSGLWGSRAMARATSEPHAEHVSSFSTCESDERDKTPPSA